MNFHGKPRAVIKEAQRQIKDSSRRYGDTLTRVPDAEWPDTAELKQVNPQPLSFWRSRRFCVIVYQDPEGLRLTCFRSMLGDDGRWIDGITWDDLQTLKRECGFGHLTALEVYPPDADLVNVANMRHLRIPQGEEWTSLVWRNEDQR